MYIRDGEIAMVLEKELGYTATGFYTGVDREHVFLKSVNGVGYMAVLCDAGCDGYDYRNGQCDLRYERIKRELSPNFPNGFIPRENTLFILTGDTKTNAVELLKKNVIHISSTTCLVTGIVGKEFKNDKNVIKQFFVARKAGIKWSDAIGYGWQRETHSGFPIIFLCAAVFALATKIGFGTSVYEKFGIGLRYTGLYREFAYMFAHADLYHLISNIVGLAIFGFFLCQYIGFFKTVATFVLGGSIAAELTLLWAKDGMFNNNAYTVTIGASGACFAIFGAYIISMGFAKDVTLRAALVSAVYLYYNSTGLNVNIGVHLAGLCAGILIGAFWHIVSLKNFHKSIGKNYEKWQPLNIEDNFHYSEACLNISKFR